MTSASFYNTRAQAPGWTEEDVDELRLCLKVYGVGHWHAIKGDGHFPVKSTSQLCALTRKLLGQQSTAEFAGIRLDVDRVKAVNDAKTGVDRKKNLIVYRGPKVSPEELAKRVADNEAVFGLTEEEIASAREELVLRVAQRRIDDVVGCAIAQAEMKKAIASSEPDGLVHEGRLELRDDSNRLQSLEYLDQLRATRLHLEEVLERMSKERPKVERRRSRYPHSLEDLRSRRHGQT